MTYLDSDVAGQTATCASCEAQLWVDDRFCRRCGDSVADGGDTIHEIDLAGPDRGTHGSEGGGGWRRLLIALATVALIAAVVIVVSIVGGSNEDPIADQDDATTPAEFPEGAFVNENPPERQAALDAFEAARERADVSVAEILDILDVDAELLIIDRNQVLRLDRFGQAGAESLLSLRLPNEWPYGGLGHADAASYRINPTARSIIDIWDSEFERWSPATLTLADRTSAAIPFSSLAISPTHVAAEAGGRVRFWSQETESEVGRVPGRLVPSTGPGFVVSECEPTNQLCELIFYDSSGEPTGDTLDAPTFTPDFDQPARISADGTQIAFVQGAEQVLWYLDRADVLVSRRTYGETIVDAAWLPDSSALVLLTSSGITVATNEAPSVRIQVDLEGASTLAFVDR